MTIRRTPDFATRFGSLAPPLVPSIHRPWTRPSRQDAHEARATEPDTAPVDLDQLFDRVHRAAEQHGGGVRRGDLVTPVFAGRSANLQHEPGMLTIPGSFHFPHEPLESAPMPRFEPRERREKSA